MIFLLLLIYSFFAELISLLNLHAVGGSNDGFKRPNLESVKVDQLNVITHHYGGGNPGPLRRPRSAHILLGYICPYTTFFTRNDLTKWVGPQLNWHANYHLFKKYKIVNTEVILEDQKGQLAKLVVNPLKVSQVLRGLQRK